MQNNQEITEQQQPTQGQQEQIRAMIQLFNNKSNSSHSNLNEINIPSRQLQFYNGHSHLPQSICQSHHMQGFPYHLLILAVFIILVGLVYFDMKLQYKSLRIESESQIRQCYKNFVDNICDDPVQILEQQCWKWKQCYLKEPQVKLTVVFTNVVASMIRNIVQTLGYLCCGVLVIAGAIITWKPKHKPQKIN